MLNDGTQCRTLPYLPEGRNENIKYLQSLSENRTTNKSLRPILYSFFAVKVYFKRSL